MRNVLTTSLTGHSNDEDFVFMTGDLGFNALEPLRSANPQRFINAGIAEQNMVSVAAGLAKTGFRPWVYSIAPFVYARPFEQIRNDLCAHDLPVRLVGNGGGYGYGAMGGTHHALEDYGVLLTLLNIQVFVPAFAEDVPSIIEKLCASRHPAYLRLGKCEKPKGFALPAYGAWRRLVQGGGPTMLAVGPLIGGVIDALSRLETDARPDLWVLTELPLDTSAIPGDFMTSLARSGHLLVVEEHVAQGGAGQMIAHRLALMGSMPPRFTHCHASGYLSGLYGSQGFHRKECGLDPESILKTLKG